MAHERDSSLDAVPSLLAAEDEYSYEGIRRALGSPGGPQGPRGPRRHLAAWLLRVVDREVRILLRPIALRYRRDFCDAAEDFVQDVLILLLHDAERVLRTWDPDRGMRLRSFISLVARRYLCRRFRGFRGNPWSIDPTDAEALSAHLDAGTAAGHSLCMVEYCLELNTILDHLHGELSGRDWRLLNKLYIDEKSPLEVGEEEGMRENAVHKWSSRFHQRVRQLFAPTRPPSRFQG